jgi:hypothetical protein
MPNVRAVSLAIDTSVDPLVLKLGPRGNSTVKDDLASATQAS